MIAAYLVKVESVTFPFHIHTPSGIVESDSLDLPEILEIIASVIVKRLF